MIKNIKLVFCFCLLILVYLLFMDNSILFARAGRSGISSRSYYKSTSYSRSYTPSYKKYNTSYPKTYDYSYSYTDNYYRPSRYYGNSYNRRYYSTSPYSYNKYDFIGELIGYAITFFVIGGTIIYSFVQSKKNTSSYTGSKYNSFNNYNKKSVFFNNYDDYDDYDDYYDNYNDRYYPNNSLEYENSYNNSYNNNFYDIQTKSNNTQVMNINDFYKLKDINHPDLLKLKDIAKNVFISVQNAWMNKNLDLVMNVISNKLYSKLYYEIEEMKNFAQKNILENIKVLDVKIVNFNDGKSNNFDNELDYDNYYEKTKLNDVMMQTYILAEMIDYVIDENSGQIIEGNNKTKTKFYEQWIFKFENNKWLADEIIRYD